jgi:hypothetical protein
MFTVTGTNNWIQICHADQLFTSAVHMSLFLGYVPLLDLPTWRIQS